MVGIFHFAKERSQYTYIAHCINSMLHEPYRRFLLHHYAYTMLSASFTFDRMFANYGFCNFASFLTVFASNDVSFLAKNIIIHKNPNNKII